MSTVLILAPVIISNWPAITAAVVGAASALGFVTKQAVEQEVRQTGGQEQKAEQEIEVELPESQVLSEQVATDQQIVVTKGAIQIIVKRDERGRCVICAKGKGLSKTELKQAAQQFTEKLTQCFIYDKVLKQLKQKNFQIVNEEVTENDDIRIHVRRWEE